MARLQRSRKGFAEVGDHTPTGRRAVAEYLKLDAVVRCLLNMHKKPAETDFGRDEVSVVAKWPPTTPATGWRLIAN